jgi:hypothetical protein
MRLFSVEHLDMVSRHDLLVHVDLRNMLDACPS